MLDICSRQFAFACLLEWMLEICSWQAALVCLLTCLDARSLLQTGCLRASGDVRKLHMTVVEAFGKLVEVFGGSRIGPEGSMSTKWCTCQRFGSPQEAASSPGPAPEMLQFGSGGCSRKPRVRL